MIQEWVCDSILASERLRGVWGRLLEEGLLFLLLLPGGHWQPFMICLPPFSPFLRGNCKKSLDL